MLYNDLSSDGWYVMNIFIRRAEVSDCLKLSELYKNCGYDTPASHIARMVCMPNGLSQTIVAVYEENVVGVAEFFIIQNAYRKNPICRISAITVESIYRSSGIGSAMISYIQKIAETQNCCFMEVESHVSRLSAHNFYKKHGFRQDTHYYFRKEL